MRPRLTLHRVQSALALLASAALADASPEADEAAVVGIWRLSKADEAEIAQLEPHRAWFELEIKPDGGFRILNPPRAWNHLFGQPAGRIWSGSGKWRLVRREDRLEVHLTMPNFPAAAPPSFPEVVLTFNRSAKVPELTLAVGVGEGGERRSVALRQSR